VNDRDVVLAGIVTDADAMPSKVIDNMAPTAVRVALVDVCPVMYFPTTTMEFLPGSIVEETARRANLLLCPKVERGT